MAEGPERKAATLALAGLAIFWLALVVTPNGIPAVDALTRLVPPWAVGTLLIVVAFGPAATHYLRGRLGDPEAEDGPVGDDPRRP